jgi:hypothetical protein
MTLYVYEIKTNKPIVKIDMPTQQQCEAIVRKLGLDAEEYGVSMFADKEASR